jgi:integrase
MGDGRRTAEEDDGGPAARDDGAAAGGVLELAEPAWSPPATGTAWERLAQLDALAEDYVASQRPANTLRSYAADWRVWEDYTAQVGIPLLASTAGALVGFVRWLETTKQAAPASIERRLTGAVVELRRYGAQPSPGAQARARQALGGYRRRLAEAGITRGRGQAHPINLADLRTVAVHCPDTLAGRRDRALLLIGFAIGARSSDLANLLATDLDPFPNGLLATVRHGKSIGASPIPYFRQPEICPVRAWQAWTATAGITTGPAYRRINRHDQLGAAVGLSPAAVNHALHRAGDRAGLAYGLTAHSLRAGLATEMRQAKDTIHEHEIADQGRWTRGSRALQQYFRTVDAWTNAPLSRLGV